MKTNMKLLSALLIAGVLMIGADALAQGKSNNRGDDKQKQDPKREHRWDNQRKRDGDQKHDLKHSQKRDLNKSDHYSRKNWRGPTHDRHGKRYTYHRPPHWAPAHGHHYKPVRYVYYRDYNVYYDCYRGVYITLSGRNWVYSHRIPAHMHRVNFHRIAYVDLDYFDDDLPRYLERRRSGYASVRGRF